MCRATYTIRLALLGFFVVGLVLVSEVGGKASGDRTKDFSLIVTSQKGRLEDVKRLLDQGANVNARGLIRESALMCAAEAGCTNVVQLLLDRGANVNDWDMYGVSALTRACKAGHTEVVGLLLERGADLMDANAVHGDGRTPLMWAAYNGHKAIVEILLKKLPDLSAWDTGGLTALECATMKKHPQVVKLLENWAAKEDAGPKAPGKSPALAAILNKRSQADDKEEEQFVEGEQERLAQVKEFLNAGADVEERDEGGNTELITAAHLGWAGVVNLLLDKGADVNAKGRRGTTALMSASAAGWNNVVSLLLNRGAEVDAREENGGTALIIAAKEGRTRTVGLLLDRGANVNARLETASYAGWTALMWASYGGRTRTARVLVEREAGDKDSALWLACAARRPGIVKLLLDKGANPNARFNNRSALMATAYEPMDFEAFRVVRALLEHGADVDAKDEEGETVLMNAAGGGDFISLKRFVRRSAKLNATNPNGETALIMAAKGNHADAVRLLLEAVADVNVKDKSRKTALQWARKKGYKEIVRLLKAGGAKE